MDQQTIPQTTNICTLPVYVQGKAATRKSSCKVDTYWNFNVYQPGPTSKVKTILYTPPIDVPPKIDRERFYVCSFEGCNKTFPRDHSSSFRIHEQRHLPYSERKYLCNYPECTKAYITMDALVYHKRTHAGIRPYKCEQCGKGFFNRSHLNEHIKTHLRKRKRRAKKAIDGENDEHIELDSSDDSSPPKVTKPKLRPKNYFCTVEQCGKAFDSPSVLKRHVKTHPGDKPVKCDRCDKTFLRNDFFKRHKKSHIRKLKYKCEKCILGFSSAAEQEEHLKLHQKLLSVKEEPLETSTAFFDVKVKEEFTEEDLGMVTKNEVETATETDTEEEDEEEDEKCSMEIKHEEDLVQSSPFNFSKGAVFGCDSKGNAFISVKEEKSTTENAQFVDSLEALFKDEIVTDKQKIKVSLSLKTKENSSKRNDPMKVSVENLEAIFKDEIATAGTSVSLALKREFESYSLKAEKVTLLRKHDPTQHPEFLENLEAEFKQELVASGSFHDLSVKNEKYKKQITLETEQNNDPTQNPNFLKNLEATFKEEMSTVKQKIKGSLKTEENHFFKQHGPMKSSDSVENLEAIFKEEIATVKRETKKEINEKNSISLENLEAIFKKEIATDIQEIKGSLKTDEDYFFKQHESTKNADSLEYLEAVFKEEIRMEGTAGNLLLKREIDGSSIKAEKMSVVKNQHPELLENLEAIFKKEIATNEAFGKQQVKQEIVGTYIRETKDLHSEESEKSNQYESIGILLSSMKEEIKRDETK